MPKLWNDTIDAHRQSVRDATMNATAALVAAQGLTAVTMSRIAKDTGVGRATLYKYFPDVEAILLAWHERQIGRHLEEMQAARATAKTPLAALRAVLETYARLSRHGHDGPLSHMLHASDHARRTHHQLAQFLRDLIAEAADSGEVRSDVPPAELAAYCLAALTADGHGVAKAATDRLLIVVFAGLGAEQS